MKRSSRRLTSPFLLLALATAGACGTSSRVVRDELRQPATIGGVEIGNIEFDYAKWTMVDAERLQRAKEYETSWKLALASSLLARATRLGLTDGEPKTRLGITIVDLDPGSRTMRGLVGFGAGTGIIAADVTVGAHGSMRVDSKIVGGAWGGDFIDVMDELGVAIVNHLHDRKRRDGDAKP